ncbi:MAG: hypothetical protein R3B70_47480, partial [Polyangiaceae bacterium]
MKTPPLKTALLGAALTLLVSAFSIVACSAGGDGQFTGGGGSGGAGAATGTGADIGLGGSVGTGTGGFI